MDSEKPAAFRPNPQVGVMILVILAALFVPLLGVAWLARDYFKPKPAVVAEPVGLRETIERSAEEALAHEPIAPERPVLRLENGPPALALEEIVKPLGATAISIGENRYLVTGPAGTAEALAKMWNLEAPAVGEDGLFEVDMTTGQ